jgi:hypothetical protein
MMVRHHNHVQVQKVQVKQKNGKSRYASALLQVQILVQVRTSSEGPTATHFEMLDCELGTTVLAIKQQVGRSSLASV